MKHTKGPWSFEVIENNGCNVYAEKEKDTFEAHIFGESLENEKANARLISAAPEMLEMLLMLRADFADSDTDDCNIVYLEKLDAVIAKASLTAQGEDT